MSRRARLLGIVRWAATVFATPFDRFLTGRAGEYLLPTLSTLYVNKTLVGPPPAPRLPAASWAQRERLAMLDRSIDRLRGIEAKGPALATVSAIFAGAVLLALATQWDDSNVAGKALLVTAAGYTVASLLMPIYLVGQQRRYQLDGLLEAAAAEDDPEEWLAQRAGELWARNSERITKLGNLQDAARNELALAFAVLIAWALLVPVSGALEAQRTSKRPSATPTDQVTHASRPSRIRIVATRSRLIRLVSHSGRANHASVLPRRTPAADL